MLQRGGKDESGVQGGNSNWQQFKHQLLLITIQLGQTLGLEYPI